MLASRPHVTHEVLPLCGLTFYTVGLTSSAPDTHTFLCLKHVVQQVLPQDLRLTCSLTKTLLSRIPLLIYTLPLGLCVMHCPYVRASSHCALI